MFSIWCAPRRCGDLLSWPVVTVEVLGLAGESVGVLPECLSLMDGALTDTPISQAALPLGAGQEVLSRLRAVTGVEARLAAIIDLAIEQHRGMHHFAAVELLVAARQDPALAQAIRPHFEVAENQLDRWFCDYMAELNWAESALVAFRTVMVAALRGLALDHVLKADSEAHKAALSMFRLIFLGHIAKVATAGS